MKFNQLAFLFISLFILSSCYEREEACLDLLAKDYSLSADDACEDCCTYPSLQIRVFNKIGEDSYSIDSVMVNDSGDSFRIVQSRIILSDFDLTLSDNAVLSVRETAEYEDTEGEGVELTEDHVIATTSSSLLTPGTIRETGEVQSLEFKVGIDNDLIAIEEESILFDYDTLHTSDGYYDISLYVKVGGSLETNKIVRLFLDKDDSLILLDGINVNKIERTDYAVQINIDYEQFLQSVVLNEQDVQLIYDYNLPNNLITLEE